MIEIGKDKDRLLRDFKRYLEQEIRDINEIPFSSEINEIINFFIEKGFFSQTIIRSYTILKTYNSLNENEGQTKKSTRVKAIAAKYGIHENTVWNTLKKNNSTSPKR